MLHSLVYIRSNCVRHGGYKTAWGYKTALRYLWCSLLSYTSLSCSIKEKIPQLYECYMCTCLHHYRCFSQKTLSVPSSMHCPIQPGCRWVVCKEFHYSMSHLMWTPINYRDVMNVSRSYTHYILYVGWKVLARICFDN